MNSMLPLPELLLAGAFLFGIYSWYKSRRSLVPLPPGPKGYWLLENSLDIANAKYFWTKLSEYADQYGPVVTIGMVRQPTFVLSDPRLVAELFEKRAANYSDKDENEMAKLIGWNTDILFIHYGPILKLYRTMLTRALNNRVALDYLPLQQHEIRRFMKRLVETPEEFMAHVRLLSASIAVRIAYGYKVDSYEDRFVQTAEKHMEGFSECMQPWNWAVNTFPFLRYLPDWLPIAPFQRRVLEARQIFKAHRENPFAYVEEQMAAGTAEDSFTAKLLVDEDGMPVDEETKEHIKSIAGTLYAAGSDTTVSAVQSFILAMTLYPEIQKKAQAEIAAYFKAQSTSSLQEVNGRQMIMLDDRSNLPYTSALVRELLRWHPIVPIVGHRSSNEEDNNVVSEGKSYRIPAKSLMLVNVWRIMHNPEVYPDPERFMPERFLTSNPPPDSESYAFGFGRRSCPGMHIAQQSMWIAISNLLANFIITKAKDEKGYEIIPQEEYTNMIVSHPLPFKCSIVPREGCKQWLMDVSE